MKKSTLNKLFGFGFFVLVFVIIAYLYTSSSSTDDTIQVSSFSSPVDIVSVESSAKKLISTRDNNAGIPIPVPVDKLGKTNPFSNPE